MISKLKGDRDTIQWWITDLEYVKLWVQSPVRDKTRLLCFEACILQIIRFVQTS